MLNKSDVDLSKEYIINILRYTPLLTRKELKYKTCLKDEFLREAIWQLLEESKLEITWDLKLTLSSLYLNKKERQNMSTQQVPVITLKEAIQDAVNHYKRQKADFSVFELTTLIRERTNAQLYYVEGVFVNQIPIHPMTGKLERQSIYHSSVLNEFNDLWKSAPDPNYTLTVGSLYRIFKYTDVVVGVTAATTTANSTVTFIPPTMVDNFAATSADVKGKPIVSPETKFATRLKHYLEYGRPYRIKYNNEFIVLSKGRTAWRRPCNAGYSLNRWAEKNSVYDTVQTLKKEGKIQFVKVEITDDTTTVSTPVS